MTPTAIPCPVCYRPTLDGTLCNKRQSADDEQAPCTAKLTAALRELPDLMAELETTLTRQAKISSGGAGKATSIPLPFSYDASWTKDAVVNTVCTWIRELAESYGEKLDRETLVCGGHACVVVTDWTPGYTPKTWTDWLLQRMHRIRSHVAVEQLYDELMDAVRSVRKAIDRPAEQEFVTTCCICGHGVYGPAGAHEETWIACRSCRRVADRDPETGEITGYVPEYQIGAEQVNRLAALRAQLLPERDVLVAVQSLQHRPLSPKTFRSWVNRWREGVVGRAALPARACRVEDGALLYHVDEALQLAQQIPVREEPVKHPNFRRRISA